jgi:hypothetical protein
MMVPKLLYFADGGRRGLGATIRLDSGEPCLISCAQTGVRVKKTRYGFLGPILFEEKSAYRAARTAMTLDDQFPDSLLPPGFTNPVLKAFANAILHCATCAEVTVILNEASNSSGKVEATTDAARHAPERQAQQSAARNKIIVDYGAHLEEHSKHIDTFVDLKALPHPKEDILNALLIESVLTPSDKEADQLRGGVYFLSDFHEGVGAEPLPRLGVALSRYPGVDVKSPESMQRAREAIDEMASKIASNPNTERAARFRELAAEDLKLIEAKVEIARAIRMAIRI